MLGPEGPKEAGDVLGRPEGPKEAGDVLGPEGPKEAGDVLGPLGSEKGAVLAFLSADAQAAGLAVSTLFTQVALALLRLERAVAATESAAAQFLFEPVYGALLSPADYERAVTDRFKRTFGVLKEASLQARRRIRRILAHPLYGLGPGPEGLGQEERDELAAAADLSPHAPVVVEDFGGWSSGVELRQMKVIRAFVTAVLCTLVVQPSAECQPSRDVGALQRQVRALIDNGRYASGRKRSTGPGRVVRRAVRREQARAELAPPICWWKRWPATVGSRSRHANACRRYGSEVGSRQRNDSPALATACETSGMSFSRQGTTCKQSPDSTWRDESTRKLAQVQRTLQRT